MEFSLYSSCLLAPLAARRAAQRSLPLGASPLGLPGRLQGHGPVRALLLSWRVALQFPAGRSGRWGGTVPSGAGPDQLTEQLDRDLLGFDRCEPRGRAARVGWPLAGGRGTVWATCRAQLLEALQLRESKAHSGQSSVSRGDAAVTGLVAGAAGAELLEAHRPARARW